MRFSAWSSDVCSSDLRGPRRSAEVDLLGVFAVLWALAAIWHLLGATTSSPAWAQALLTAGVAAVLLRPGAVAPLALLAVGGLVTMWEEAPVLGNHWLLAGCVNLVILMAVLVAAARRRFGDRVDLANRILPDRQSTRLNSSH